MNKGFWMANGIEHLTDGNVAINNPSKMELKRCHQWFADETEAELFPNKKQAVQTLDTSLTPGMLNASVPTWEENNSSFEPVPNQFIDRLFGSDTAQSVSLSETNVSHVGEDSSNVGRKLINEQFENVSSVGLSISNGMEDPETCLGYGGIRKVKVNQVKESINREIVRANTNQPYIRVNESSSISTVQGYNKEDDSITLMGHTYSRDGSHIRSVGPVFGKSEDSTLSGDHTYEGDANTVSFSGFHDEPVIPLARQGGSYDFLYNHSSVRMPEAASEGELIASAGNVVAGAAQGSKSRPEIVSKNKLESKISKKEAPNSFPSNVRSLISTGMLDGVPIKYVSLSRQELRGVIKGSGYLCGCQSCNFSKALNAYEFERHANCKTKHPNNHIYFDNGKTIYQIVQELKSTPESKLFDTIQTVFGAPINQKAFRIWKESFQAATRELQRIYGKEELNL